MGVEVNTIRTYTCDRCGSVSNTEIQNSGFAYIAAKVCFQGDDGGTGGSTSKLYLCGLCTCKFMDFISGWKLLDEV